MHARAHTHTHTRIHTQTDTHRAIQNTCVGKTQESQSVRLVEARQ